MRENQITTDDFDIGQTSKEDVEVVVNEILSWQEWRQKSSDELFQLIRATDYLDVNDIMYPAIKLFAKSSSQSPSGFHEQAAERIKRLIIEKQSPTEFKALVRANPLANGTEEEERSFRIALYLHYQEEDLPSGVSAKERYEKLFSTLIPQFVSIPGGVYKIGSPATEEGRKKNENLHSVTLSPFSIMEAAVTQEEYAKVIGENPARFKISPYCPKTFKEITVNGMQIGVCPDHPVERVDYNDAQEFAERMNKIDPTHIYSLPTEAQLEVAFRGGTDSAYVTGRDDDVGLQHYIFLNPYNNPDHPNQNVKSMLSNKYGVYRANIREWAKDSYDMLYSGSTGLDPEGPQSGYSRVVRGCYWTKKSCSTDCRSASRDTDVPNRRLPHLGFRLVRKVAIASSF